MTRKDCPRQRERLVVHVQPKQMRRSAFVPAGRTRLRPDRTSLLPIKTPVQPIKTSLQTNKTCLRLDAISLQTGKTSIQFNKTSLPLGKIIFQSNKTSLRPDTAFLLPNQSPVQFVNTTYLPPPTSSARLTADTVSRHEGAVWGQSEFSFLTRPKKKHCLRRVDRPYPFLFHLGLRLPPS